MDYCAQITKISEYYKKRYEKALKMGIQEGTKHNKAFQEIKLRYEATEMAVEVLESLKDHISGERFERNVFSGIKLIVNVLTISGTVINEDGTTVWKQPKIVIQKSNSELLQFYTAGKDAVRNLSSLDYVGLDRESVYQQVLRYALDIVNWLLMAREEIFRVGCEWNIAKEGK